MKELKLSLQDKFLKKYMEEFAQEGFLVDLPDGAQFQVGKTEPKFKLKLRQDLDKRSLLQSTSVALGEAYMDGTLDIEGDLFYALKHVMGGMDKFKVDKKALKDIIFTAHTEKRQKKEISYHYDLGNDFYKLWLDDTMSYSCAYFKTEEDSLGDAQKNKVEHILKKLNLQKGMRLLDIGCGWGYLILEAAKHYGVHAVGITLSKEQYAACNQKIEEEGLQDFVSVYLMDYRELDKLSLHFDRIVSVGMLEHVGREKYKLFIKTIMERLEDKGLFLLHFISGRKEEDGDPWIKKYIFPGGVVPSLREVMSLCAEEGFHSIHMESLRRHYMKTLLLWNQGFQHNRARIVGMFDERFARMWELYLCGCAASFHNGIVDIHQILYSKGVNNEIPMTLNYLYS